MQAITVQDRTAGLSGMSLSEVPYPHAAENDVMVEVRAGGFTRRARPRRRPFGRRRDARRHRLADLVARVRSGRLKPSIGSVYSLTEAASALQGDRRASGKTIIRPGGH